MGFLQFYQPDRPSRNGKLHWGLYEEYGAPLRGDLPGPIPEREMDRHIDRTDEVHFGIFDTSQPEQRIDGRTYREVLEGIVAGWFRLSYRRHFARRPTGDGPPKVYVYIEWIETYMEPVARGPKPP